MLPDIRLDEITFEEMIEQAKKKIAASYPEWTDFNYHDPGMTLIEMFAWLKEIQQYEMNHISDEHKRRYLKLLGMGMRHRTSAKTYASVAWAKPIRIPKGSCIKAPGMVFETERSQMLPGTAISQCFGVFGKKVSYLAGEQLNFGYAAEFYPFGREALAGTSLYIGFSGTLPCGEVLGLTIQMGGFEGVVRNPVSADTLPLAKLSYAYWDGAEFSPLEILEDETFGFLYDGQLLFRLSKELKSCCIEGEEGYYLRVTLEESQYEQPPVWSFLDINTVRIRQKESVAVWLLAKKVQGKDSILSIEHGLCANGRIQVFMELEDYYYKVEQIEQWRKQEQLFIKVLSKEFERARFWVLVSSPQEWYHRHQVLGVAHGFPNESFGFDEEVLSYEDLELLIEEPDRPEVYRKWEKRDDFSNSGPEDYHYRVDGMNGRVMFGDCFRGRAPEGKILVVSYARILGERGNIKSHKLLGFQQTEWEEIPVTNLWDAQGGQNEETIEEAFVRARMRLQEARSMVTAEDYEQAVLKTPGLCVESCKALVGIEQAGESQNGQQIIQLVVKPGSFQKHPQMTEVYAQNIRNYLEPKRLIGMELKLLSPVYIRLSVHLEVQVYPQYQDAQNMVEQAVEKYLILAKTNFGGTVSYSGLYGYIDRLTCVAAVGSLVLEGKGNGVRRNTYGDLLLPGNGIADEIEIQCSCSIMGEDRM